MVPESTREAISEIIDAGFPFIKVELEATFGRRNSNLTVKDCETCNHTGRLNCSRCKGQGYKPVSLVIQGGISYTASICLLCRGRTFVICDNCQGRGKTSNCPFDIENDSECGSYILSQLSAAERKKIVYSRFYYDGSVDSELTFTLPITEIQIVPKVIKAFSTLKSFTGRIDTFGAGMHTSVLQESYYPTDRRLPTHKVDNFIEQVTKLLPALYFLASPDCRSRSMGFRQPRISSHDKYSAIFTHRNTCLEYRVFETCYGRPDAFYDYVETINRTLDYYRDPSKKVASIGKKFRFKEGLMVHRFFDTPETLEILYRRLRTLKPKSKTIAQLKTERGFSYSKPTLMQRILNRNAHLESQFNKFMEIHPQFIDQEETLVNMLFRLRERLGDRVGMSGIRTMVRTDRKKAAFEMFKASHQLGSNRRIGQSIDV